MVFYCAKGYQLEYIKSHPFFEKKLIAVSSEIFSSPAGLIIFSLPCCGGVKKFFLSKKEQSILPFVLCSFQVFE